MAVAASDLEFRLSGGASNTDESASIGGIMSSSVITSASLNNLFDDVSQAESTSGDTEYRCFYVINTHATDTINGVVIWIDTNTPSTDTDASIGLDPAGTGDGSTTGVAATPADESTAPTGVTFSQPATAGAGLTIGNLGPSDAAAVWVKRVVTAGAAGYSADSVSVTIRGTPA